MALCLSVSLSLSLTYCLFCFICPHVRVSFCLFHILIKSFAYLHAINVPAITIFTCATHYWVNLSALCNERRLPRAASYVSRSLKRGLKCFPHTHTQTHTPLQRHKWGTCVAYMSWGIAVEPHPLEYFGSFWITLESCYAASSATCSLPGPLPPLYFPPSLHPNCLCLANLPTYYTIYTALCWPPLPLTTLKFPRLLLFLHFQLHKPFACPFLSPPSFSLSLHSSLLRLCCRILFAFHSFIALCCTRCHIGPVYY